VPADFWGVMRLMNLLEEGMNKGTIVDIETFDELFLRNAEFNRLAQLGELQDNQASS